MPNTRSWLGVPAFNPLSAGMVVDDCPTHMLLTAREKILDSFSLRLT